MRIGALIGFAFLVSAQVAYAGHFGDIGKGKKIRMMTSLDIPPTWPVPIVAETLRMFFGTSIETGEILRLEPDKRLIDRKNAPFCMIQFR